MRSIPRRAHSERPGPRRPQPHLSHGICDVDNTVHWTADARRRMQHDGSVQHGRTERAAGDGRVRAALAVTSRGFDSWRTRAARRRRPRRGATGARRSILRACAARRAGLRGAPTRNHTRHRTPHAVRRAVPDPRLASSTSPATPVATQPRPLSYLLYCLLYMPCITHSR